ncbi:MAG: ABC transporter permease [Opitutales bacterium]|nr:ABC transporter permease [Opitutales bacterium]
MKLKFYRILFGIRGWFTSALNHFGTQADLEAEISHHLEQNQHHLESSGLSSKQARKLSLREFGNAERLKEECRDNWGMQTLSNITRDARFAFRKMSKNKVTTLIAITILALSIGAATSVFSIVNTVLLNELPVPNPQELRMIYWKGSQTKIRSCSNDYVKQMGPTSISDGLSHPIFLALRERCRDYAEVFAFDLVKESTAQIGNHTFATKLLLVSDNFLSGLHAKPAIGRGFEASDVAQSAPNVVISHDVWAKYFHSRPDAIGSTIRLSGDLYTVIGVAPNGFEGVNPGQAISFYLPMTENSRFLHKPLSTDWHWGTRTMLRLKPGAKDKQVKQLLDAAFIPMIADLAQEPEIVLATGHAGQRCSIPPSGRFRSGHQLRHFARLRSGRVLPNHHTLYNPDFRGIACNSSLIRKSH